MHARYRSPLTSRFLSTDPILGTPALPQSWNRYAYVAGNPLNLVDPTGAILISATGQATLLAIAGQDASSISFGENGAIDTSQLSDKQLAMNEGALLLRQMAVSANVFTYEEGSTATTSAGASPVNGVLNLDDNPFDVVLVNGNGIPKAASRFPAAGVNGAVTVDPGTRYFDQATGTREVPKAAIAFHELAESYERVQFNMQRGPNSGPGAHFVARMREIVLMNQRPTWTPYPAGGDLKR